MLRDLSTKEIEDKAIKYVEEYLRERGENPQIIKRGIDVISEGKYIEVKGSMKRATNLRVVPKSLEFVKMKNKMEDYYIYYVYDMKSEDPKMMIFNYDLFLDNKIKEVKWIIQPHKIKREKDTPDEIHLLDKDGPT